MSARVLIVVPTLGRRPELLAETLQSVRAQGPVDLVVVCPSNATAARSLAREHGALVEDDPGGLSAAINRGMACATPAHEFANWIGDDDLLTAGSVQATTSALDRDRTAVAVYGACRYIDEHGRTLWVSRAGRIADWLLRWGPDLVPQPGMLFRTEAFRAVGGLDESLRFAMDLDLLLKLRRHGRLLPIPATVSAFRWHPTSLTVADRSTSLRESEMVKRRHLPPPLRRLAPAWEAPVRYATRTAASRINRRAAALSRAERVS